jgi:predicted acyl esterase
MMTIDWDVPIAMADGTVLRADVFRPGGGGQYPVIMTYGPYAKGLAFQEGYAAMWDNLVREHPDAVAGSTNRYLNWETVDPEKWVPDGYAVVRVDSRGAGNSPGYLDIFSRQETRDYYECIEWAGTQPWSNGKVGLLGISYYGVNQWQVAALRPPHLAASSPTTAASSTSLSASGTRSRSARCSTGWDRTARGTRSQGRLSPARNGSATPNCSPTGRRRCRSCASTRCSTTTTRNGRPTCPGSAWPVPETRWTELYLDQAPRVVPTVKRQRAGIISGVPPVMAR